jgi:hypothetical protein
MKKKSIARLLIYAGLISILAFILIPETRSSHHPDWQIVAKTKLRSLNVLYATYTTSGARVRILHTIEELKEFVGEVERWDDSLFSTYDPLNKKETPVLYFRPKSSDKDELVFVFQDPILRHERPTYNDDDLKELRYIACYTRSGIVSLESEPPELTQSEPVDAANASNAASVNLNQSARIR